MMQVLAQEPGEDGLESRFGPRSVRKRKCIASGDVLPEARLVRFVADPNLQIVTDVDAKLPGRGMWVRSEREWIARAVAKKLFARAGKAPLRAVADLPARVESRLAERMLAGLGLARRAGELLLGFDMIEKALRGISPPAVVVEAADASPEGARQLQAASVARGVVPFVIRCFVNADLSLALGRANVVHAALKPGRMAERLIFDAGRISGFRPLEPWIWAKFSSETPSDAGIRGSLV